jgi:hypothetical protein
MVEALGLETNDVTFDEENEYGVKVPKTVRFVKTEKLGVLPASWYLLSQRAATRKRIKTCTQGPSASLQACPTQDVLRPV